MGHAGIQVTKDVDGHISLGAQQRAVADSPRFSQCKRTAVAGRSSQPYIGRYSSKASSPSHGSVGGWSCNGLGRVARPEGFEPTPWLQSTGRDSSRLERAIEIRKTDLAATTYPRKFTRARAESRVVQAASASLTAALG